MDMQKEKVADKAIFQVSVNDFNVSDGNLLVSNIFAMLEEMFKVQDRILLVESQNIYSHSEVEVLANDILSLKESSK